MSLMGELMKITLTTLTAHIFFLACLAVPIQADAEIDETYFNMDLAQLMQVSITSVSKKPQNLADTAAAAYVITQDDIRRSGVTSIPEALALAPGVQVARISASEWSISARGFGGYTSNKLLVMIDGRSVYSPAFSGTYWDQQNTLLEDIDRIEVIRGPGGTIWGANAVNGVVNIITKKAEDTQGTLIRAGAGNQERFMGAARYGGKIGDSTYGRIYVTSNDCGSNVLAANDQDADDGWRSAQGGFRLDGKKGAANEWSLQGNVYDNHGSEIISPFWTNTPPYFTSNYSSYSTAGSNLNGSWKHKLTGGDLLTLNAYYDNTNRKEVYFEQSFATVDVNLQYETHLGDRNNLTMGAGYRRIDGEFMDTFQVQIPDQVNNLYSLFLQDDIKLIPDILIFTLGTKYEHNDFTGNEMQPSARLLWKPATDHSLWTSVARAVRTPTMVEEGGSVTVAAFPTPYGTQTTSLRGNPDFGSETLIAYEAGYRWQASKKFSLDVAVYYNDYEDIYTTLPKTKLPVADQYFVNAQNGTGYGMETAVNWKTNEWLSFIVTYTWQNLDLNWDDPSLATQNNLNGDFVSKSCPRNQISLRSAVELATYWQFNWWLRYVDAIKGRDSVDQTKIISVPSYFLLDANLIWKPQKGLEIMLAGQNLLNSNQLEYISEFLTPSVKIERGVYLKATWSF
jgi:iron complex outermembrane recepter protein